MTALHDGRSAAPITHTSMGETSSSNRVVAAPHDYRGLSTDQQVVDKWDLLSHDSRV